MYQLLPPIRPERMFMLKKVFSQTNGLSWFVVAMLGILVGLSLFTFVYARGGSYFLDDPQACLNCHIMRDQYDAWNHSTHKQVANCIRCYQGVTSRMIDNAQGQQADCLACHGNVGHSTRN